MSLVSLFCVASHIGRTLVSSKYRSSILMLDPFAYAGQGHKVPDLTIGDSLDDSPGYNVKRKIVDNCQQVLSEFNNG